MLNSPNPLVRQYVEEALELLSNIENHILLLEKDKKNKEWINAIFRALHTIKGSGSMFGLTEIVDLTHNMETIYDEYRHSGAEITTKVIEMTLTYCDTVYHLMVDENSSETRDDLNLLKEDMASTHHTSSKPGIRNVYRIRFIPGENLFKRGIDPLFFIKELKNLGECHIFAHQEDVPLLTEIDYEKCYTSWNFILITEEDLNRVQDVFIFLEKDSQVKIDLIDSSLMNDNIDYKKIGELLLERGDISSGDLAKLLKEKQALGELAIKKGLISEEDLTSALAEQSIIRRERQLRQKNYTAETIRVNHVKLDELINLVGEIVTLEARLKQFSKEFNNNELNNISENLTRLTSSLRDNSLNLRMVPLDKIFSTFQRLIRDLAQETGKEINLRISGGETELDKNVIESLKDPLVHLIRNCVDHGIESAEKRKALGKPIQGTIQIEAYYSGAFVTLLVSDDGQGIDTEKLWKKAEGKKIIDHGKIMTEKEKLDLIFAPGLSSADITSNISGRGVGMDVVKKNLEKLRGYIEVNSVPGQGTQFELKIPLTLAIIDGLLFSVGKHYFILNLGVIEECMDFTEALAREMENSSLFLYRGKLIPYCDLRTLFHIEGEASGIRQIIVVQGEGTTFGIIIDNAIRKHQTVIKPVSKIYQHIKEISGATILGDGSMALILDAGRIAANLIKTSLRTNELKEVRNAE